MLLVLACIAIVVLSIVPYGDVGTGSAVFSIGLDKICHFLGFAGLLLLAFRSKPAFGPGRRWMMIGVLLLYGAALECIQHFIPYRSFNPMDMIANALGVVFGALLWHLFCGIRIRLQKGRTA